MLDNIVAKAAYLFAVIVGLVLMVLEHYLADSTMVVLICGAVIGHVWLTRRSVKTLIKTERTNAVRSTIDFLREIDRRLPEIGRTPFE